MMAMRCQNDGSLVATRMAVIWQRDANVMAMLRTRDVNVMEMLWQRDGKVMTT